ncbi:Saposin B domain and Saposin-like domain-containing protein [Strongyloides ratti]|uniref:Saposin B domain and Saposin-like domain-containing protein n=1 Tax=Strongyloides ratti TaxID=34506 RepID=A0A090LJ36_STRRB|nr:Saposin B domain and Saposin-like domain-containing protein [Strongyloides ratti]CEF69827.1 Saposin B domain and Saposin-like domain-containing protein [Strongyloides ratti]
MKVLALITLFALIFITSSNVIKKDAGINCGLRYRKNTMAQQFIGRVRGASLICEMCLDLVLVGEQYAECGEEYVADKLEAECDKYLGTNFLDKICHTIVGDLATEIVNDTEKDPSKLCSKVLKKKCSYA